MARQDWRVLQDEGPGVRAHRLWWKESWPKSGQSFVTLDNSWSSLSTSAHFVTKALGPHGFLLLFRLGTQETPSLPETAKFYPQFQAGGAGPQASRRPQDKKFWD